MLILLSSPGGPENGVGETDEGGERGHDGQIPEAGDDYPWADERRTATLVEALAFT